MIITFNAIVIFYLLQQNYSASQCVCKPRQHNVNSSWWILVHGDIGIKFLYKVSFHKVQKATVLLDVVKYLWLHQIQHLDGCYCFHSTVLHVTENPLDQTMTIAWWFEDFWRCIGIRSSYTWINFFPRIEW